MCAKRRVNVVLRRAIKDFSKKMGRNINNSAVQHKKKREWGDREET